MSNRTTLILSPTAAGGAATSYYFLPKISIPYPISPPPFSYLSLPPDASQVTGVATVAQAKSIVPTQDTRNDPDFLHLAEKFGTAVESDDKRAITATNCTVSCVYIFPSTTTAQCLVLPTEVPRKGCYIANASSNPTKLRPVKVGLAAFGAHYQLMENEQFKKIKDVAFRAGAPFPKSSIPTLESFMPGNANKKFVIFLTSNATISPFGPPGTASGTISDLAAALIEDSHPISKIILDLMTKYDSNLGPAIEANIAAVQPHLPTVPPGCTIHTSPFVSATPLTVEEEEGDEFGAPVAELQGKLDILNPTKADDDSLPLRTIHTLPTSPPPTPVAQSTEKDATEIDDTLTRFSLLAARLETNPDGSQRVVPGVVHKDLVVILKKTKSSNRSRALMSYIINRMQAKENSIDYVERSVNWQGIKEMVVAAWVLGLIGNPDPVTSLDELTTQQLGLTSAQFTRATHKQTKEHIAKARQAAATRQTEDLMGVSSNDPSRTRPITTTFANTNIATPEALLTCGANHIFLVQALCKFDLRGPEVPDFVETIVNLTDATSTAAFLTTLSYHPQRAKYCYYIFSQFGALLRSILAFATDETNITYAQDASTIHLINPKPLADLKALGVIGLHAVLQFKKGSADVPGSCLYHSSVQHREEQKRKLSDLGFTATPTITKHQRHLKTPEITTATKPPPATLPQPDRSGVIICAGGRMPEPTNIRHKQKVPALCFMKLREGTVCPYGSSCKNSHKHISDWPVSLLEDWDTWISKHESLSWNAAAIPQKIFAKLTIS